MSTMAIFALMEAGGFDFNVAKKIITNLESNGLTIYKKKIHKNPRRPVASQPMTPNLAEAIKAYYAYNPTATQSQIASVFNVNSGRVNEVLS